MDSPERGGLPKFPASTLFAQIRPSGRISLFVQKAFPPCGPGKGRLPSTIPHGSRFDSRSCPGLGGDPSSLLTGVSRAARAGEGAPGRANPRNTPCRLPGRNAHHPYPRGTSSQGGSGPCILRLSPHLKTEGVFGAKPGPRNRPGRRSGAAPRSQAGRARQPNHRLLLLPEDGGGRKWHSDHDSLVPLQLSELATKTQQFFEIPASSERRGEIQAWLCWQRGLEKLSVAPRPHEPLPAP